MSQVIGYIKGKSAIRFIWRECMGNGSGILWVSISGRGDTSYRQWGRDERVIREYIRNQEKEDERFDQMKLEYCGVGHRYGGP